MGKILSRQEKRMREIVREELNGVDWFQFVQALTKEEHPLLNFILDSRKVLPRVARPRSTQSVSHTGFVWNAALHE